MKKPFLAFLLSFLLPGAGLAYLGKWKWAIINLSVVLGIGLLLAFILSDEVFEKCIRPIAAGLAGGSGGLAQLLAKQMNEKATSKDVV
ncbi:MAG: hypothetical protein JWM68_5508 [Verrucomicrobiales bacterium]|nr:hypothetical protein [Verrucomicrobiales bacterium]